MLKTIFFDIGNVIFNEDFIRFKYYEALWMYLRKYDEKWTFEYIIELREKLIIHRGDKAPYMTLAREFLSANDFRSFQYEMKYFSDRHHYRYINVIPGMRQVLSNLNHYYSLGIIANQPERVHKWLKHFRLNLFFRVVALSEELRLFKPDPRLFQWALEKAKTSPDQAVMIGDRLDYDILPAKQLGMHTILARFDARSKGILSQQYREKIFFESLNRVPVWRQKPHNRHELPSAIVEKPEEILKAIQEVEASPQQQEMPISAEEEINWWDLFRELTGEETRKI